MRWCWRRATRDERGSVAVEFALLVFPFLLLMFGTIQYSLYFFSGQSGASAAREAARRAAVGDLSCSQLTSNAQATSRLVSSGFTVTRKYYAPPGTTSERAAGGVQIGDNVRVVVSYNTVNLHFPLIPVPDAGSISETAVARVETVTSNTTSC